MKSALSPTLSISSTATLETAGAIARLWNRATAFFELTKARLAVLVLLTVAVGFVLGARSNWRSEQTPSLLLTLVGIGLVAAGGGAWNQYLERDRDSLMRRTASRPIPGGRVEPIEAAVFGTILAGAGLLILGWGVRPLAAMIAFATFLLYAFVYTPLKTRTTLNTAVGAIPGALPPVIGWTAATGRLDFGALALFLIVFLWQFPHFLAIAWIYRDDYARAGHKMLPCVDPAGAIVGRQAVFHALALLPVGLLPAVVGLSGPIYFLGALFLGVFYLIAAIRFRNNVNDFNARKLLWASFVYLPIVLTLLVLNPAG